MNDSEIEYSVGVPESFLLDAAKLYDEAFGSKFTLAVRNRAERISLLAASFVPQFGIAAICNRQLVGIAGFHTPRGSLTGGIGIRRLLRDLGVLRGLWAAAVFSLYERHPAENELVMDGIAVRGDKRCLGIGSGLLDRITEYAACEGFHTIRLDVIDTNPRARQLYGRKGFVETRTEHFGYLRGLLGFGASTTMEFRVQATA